MEVHPKPTSIEQENDVEIRSTRQKKISTKSRVYQKEVKEKKLRKLFKHLDNQMIVINQMLSSDTLDQSVLRIKYKEWMIVFEEYITCHNEYCDLLTKEEHITYFLETFSPQDSDLRQFKLIVEEAISRLIKEQQRQEELKAERAYLKEKQELQQAKLALEQKEEELLVNLRLDQATAKYKALRKMGIEHSILLEPKEEINCDVVNKSDLNPRADEYIPPPENITHKTRSQMEVQDQKVNVEGLNSGEVLLSFAKILSKPKTDIDKFSGNPLQYQRFIRQFKHQVLDFCETDEERLNYLLQYTTDEAHKIVSSVSHSSTGFSDAMNEIYERYGKPNTIANKLVKDALEREVIKPNDPKRLDEYAIFLTECKYAMTDLNSVRVLESECNMQTLVKKLPFYLHDRWSSIVFELKRKDQSVTFNDLVSFVRKEATKANDPTYGKQALSSTSTSTIPSKPSSSHAGKNRQINKQSFVVNNIQKRDEVSRNQRRIEPSEEDLCSYCKGKNHALSTCFALKTKPIGERLNFLKTQGICFGCFKPGHRRKVCREMITCSLCHGFHPLVLHEDLKTKPSELADKQESTEKAKKETISSKSKPAQSNPVNASTSNVQCSDMGAGEVKMAIIPVKVRMKGKNAIVKTYLFLDNGSSVAMGTNNLSKSIGGVGRRKKLTLETVGKPYEFISTAVEGVEVAALDSDEYLSLPTIYTKDKMPVTKDHIPSRSDLEEWPHLRDIELPELDAEIGLLIGSNVPEAYRPLDFKIGPENTPHATKTILGWIPWNIVKKKEIIDRKLVVNRAEVTAIKDVEVLNKLVKDSYKFDFPENLIDEKKESSVEDKRFLKMVEDSILFKDGHYQIRLPFKNNTVLFPNNYQQALHRLMSLKRKMLNYPQFSSDYISFMQDLVEKDYSEKVPQEELNRKDHKVWYIPHHGVYHPRKQDKIRVVFDCAASFEGVSLNNELLSGPNLTSSLLGVLLRFRQEKIPIIGDLEAMFYQARVPAEDMDCLRYLWWPQGDFNRQPEAYRMKVHLFGATSSPSCANAALRQTALSNVNEFDPETSNCLLRNFYVDDCLRSEETEEKAIGRIRELKAMCSRGGFNLTKFSSHSRAVLDSIPVEERCKEVKFLDIDKDELPIGRVLGVTWHAETDNFGFDIAVRDRKATRRGLLSITSSVFDPLGFASPYVLPAKIILQELTRKGLSWDAEIPNPDKDKWEKWLSTLPLLRNLEFPRCIKPADFGTVVNCQLHAFSDASNDGYGIVIYLRLTDIKDKVNVVLLIAKSRVVPLKRMTIPRLELTAATVAVRIVRMVKREIDIPIDGEFYWTDSQTVLKYIANTNARFYTFVANRLEVIRESTRVNQWRYCSTKLNPADIASRGISPTDIPKVAIWKNGPNFLWKPENNWPERFSATNQDMDPEIKSVNAAIQQPDRHDYSVIEQIVQKFSSWLKIKSILARVLYFIKRLKEGSSQTKDIIKEVLAFDGSYCQDAEKRIIAHYQNQHFREEIERLSISNQVKKSSPLYKLDPFIDNCIIRVGGRLEKSTIEYDEKHPVIIPKDCIISKRIVMESHRKVGHLGKKSTINDIRQKYWIIGINSTVKALLSKCVLCRKYTGKVIHQRMANLPSSRLSLHEPPFSRVGIDYFGPIEIKRGRSTKVKRYGVLFTCLSIRAIHLEIAHSLDMSSCINAIRRFQARRGPTLEMISDNGTNLVGAEREMRLEIENWNADQFQNSLKQTVTKWSFNPPSGSHFGGIWERMIRTVRKVLYSLLKEQIIRTDDEGLQTLFCEVENIINSRPLTETSNDAKDLILEALTPNHLLLLRKGPELPPGIFSKHDNYTQKRWRRIQYMADVFWKRWVKEYFPLLQLRQKWITPQRNLKENDVVLIVETTPRNTWTLGRVINIIKDQYGLSRIVNIKTKNTILQRPVDKLCLILEADCE